MTFFVFLYIFGEEFSQYKSLSIFCSVHKNYIKIMFDFLSESLAQLETKVNFFSEYPPNFFAVL